MKAPTVELILRLVKSAFGPDVAAALGGRIRSGLSWAPEDFPQFDARTQEIVRQWICESNLEFKPKELCGSEETLPWNG